MKLTSPALAVALVGLAAATAGCGGGGSTPVVSGATLSAQGPAEAQVVTVTGTDQRTFEPATITARVGVLQLTLKAGGVPHNLQFGDASLHGIATVRGAQTRSVRLVLDRAGTFTFTCTIHPGMDGRLVVS